MTTYEIRNRLHHEREMLRNVTRNYFPQDHDHVKALHRAAIADLKRQLKARTCPDGMLWSEHLQMCVTIPVD